MRKILILGGANQHLKFVETAKEMGIYTVVTDYLGLEDSPCKKICDEALNYNITDIESIVKFCKANNINGVVTGFLDPCQIPYAQICERLGLPCTGSLAQFYNFTNKKTFKALCRKNGVNVIPDYTEEDALNGDVEYPVFVKPVDSRGSRGQSVCYSSEEMPLAIQFAKQESSNGDILIEKYMGDCDEVQITYFLINGTIFLERTVDSNRGSKEFNLQKVVNCSISPSRYTNIYLDKAHGNVCRMIKDLGIQNGPLFMQGFLKDEEFYFFDPGLRFPGVEFERIYKKIWGIDIVKLLIEYALNGTFPKNVMLPIDGASLQNNVAAVFFPVLKAGTIASIKGLENFRKNPNVVSCLTRYDVGDTIDWTYNVNQRYAEIDMVSKSVDGLKETIDSFYNQVQVKDSDNNDMFFDKFKTECLNRYIAE